MNCKKMSTRWPSERSFGRILSSSTIFPEWNTRLLIASPALA